MSDPGEIQTERVSEVSSFRGLYRELWEDTKIGGMTVLVVFAAVIIAAAMAGVLVLAAFVGNPVYIAYTVAGILFLYGLHWVLTRD